MYFRWFHGEISAPEAEKKLAGKEKGTFLVRFSARDPGCYAISTVGSKQIKRYRVYHRPGLGYLVASTECPKLEDFINNYNKKLGLKTMCPGSPFESIFVGSNDDSDDEPGGGYSVPAFDA